MTKTAPSPRRIAVLALGSALALVAASLLVRQAGLVRLAAAEARYERRVGSLDPAAWEPSSVPAAENAGAAFLDAAAGLDLVDAARVALLASVPATEWSTAQARDAARVLARNAGALGTLHVAGALPASSYGLDWRATDAAHDPHWSRLMNACKLLAVEGRHAVRDGRPDPAVRSARTLSRLAATLAAEARTVPLLVGFACEGWQLGLAQELLEAASTTPELLAGLEAGLATPDPREQYRRYLGAEAARIHALGDNRRPPDPSLVERALWSLISPALATRQLEGWIDLVERLERPYLEVAAEQARRRPDRDDDLFETLAVPNLLNLAGRAAALASRRRATRLAIDLRREQLASGSYPATLEPAEPAAPDPLTGGRYAYRVAADGGAVLELPGASELVERLAPPRPAPSFVWRLPTGRG